MYRVYIPCIATKLNESPVNAGLFYLLALLVRLIVRFIASDGATMRTRNSFGLNPSYLLKQANIFHFRIMIPPDIRPLLGKRELRISLRIANKKRAQVLSRKLAPCIQALFMRLRNSKRKVLVMYQEGELTRDQLNKIIRDFVENALKSFEIKQATGRPGNPGTIDEQLEAYDSAIDHQARHFSMRQHVKTMGPHVDRILEEMGIGLSKDTESYQILCYELMKADIRILKANYGKLRGRFQGTDMGSILKDLDIHQAPPAPSPSNMSTEELTILLADLLNEFCKRKIESNKWKETTVRNHQPKINAILQWFGKDQPVNHITVEDARNFAKLLELLPPGFARLKEYGDISRLDPSELTGKHEQTLDVSTRREYLNFVKSVFNYAEENEYISKNPVISGLIPDKKTDTKADRLPFDDPQDLERVFNPDTYLKWSEHHPSRFWLPLLGLYTGCRLEELASLYCEHVKEIEGLWCIEINDEYDRKVKNRNAIRTIPLHPVLVDHFEFPKYVNTVRTQGHLRVFPELKKAHNKYGHYFGRWFGRYLRNRAMISDPKKVFHSFRHNVSDHLYKKLVMESLVEELTGRAGKTETRKRYAKGYRVRTLYDECILKLEYRIDLGELYRTVPSFTLK